MAEANMENCRWCLSNGLAGADPAASNQTQYMMLKLTLPNPSAMVIPFRLSGRYPETFRQVRYVLWGYPQPKVRCWFQSDLLRDY
ncbi:hypothetical protein [Rhizobium sp. 11_C7_N12_5]|uniref:hypothetical protein n=1 Tax=Rhizobium sp. 11_C7_N12_5 TaxID=3240770 RepID=UPI003F1FCD3C